MSNHIIIFLMKVKYTGSNLNVFRKKIYYVFYRKDTSFESIYTPHAERQSAWGFLCKNKMYKKLLQTLVCSSMNQLFKIVYAGFKQLLILCARNVKCNVIAYTLAMAHLTQYSAVRACDTLNSCD